MALTFTDMLNSNHLMIGGKAFRAYAITHDGSETSIDASDLDLTYIDTAMVAGGTTTDYPALTTRSGSSIAMDALSASAITVLWAIGY